MISKVLALNITWHSSIEDSKIEILDYRIKVIDSITHRQENEYTGIRSTSLLIKNLGRNRTYIVFIQARNEAGYGQFANTSATTLLPGTTNCITKVTDKKIIFLVKKKIGGSGSSTKPINDKNQ